MIYICVCSMIGFSPISGIFWLYFCTAGGSKRKRRHVVHISYSLWVLVMGFICSTQSVMLPSDDVTANTEGQILSKLCQHNEQRGKQLYTWKACDLIFATCFLSLHHKMETSQVLFMPRLLSHRKKKYTRYWQGGKHKRSLQSEMFQRMSGKISQQKYNFNYIMSQW